MMAAEIRIVSAVISRRFLYISAIKKIIAEMSLTQKTSADTVLYEKQMTMWEMADKSYRNRDEKKIEKGGNCWISHLLL